ncbi:MAG: hypothetical protein ACEY3D_00415 [Rickettsia sp.]
MVKPRYDTGCVFRSIHQG